jgi:hypothetical protein
MRLVTDLFLLESKERHDRPWTLIPLILAQTSLFSQLVAVAHRQVRQLVQTLLSYHFLMPEPWQISSREILRNQLSKPYTTVVAHIFLAPVTISRVQAI